MNRLDRLQLSESLTALAKEMRENSERWFPELHATYDSLGKTIFYGLGHAGEAGEVANEVKKLMRNVGGDTAKLATEMADSFTYLLLLADHAGVDLIDAYLAKRDVNEARWGVGNEPDA